MNTKLINLSKDYISTLEDIKIKIKSAQIKAHLSVNQEMLILYWQIGRVISYQRQAQKWGGKIIKQLADDLKMEFQTMKGFSKRNLEYMASFYEAYAELLIINKDQKVFEKQSLIVHQPGAQLESKYFINSKQDIYLKIPWRHNVEIITKVKGSKERLWYAKKTVENSWSRNVLMIQIDSNLYARQAKKELKTNNFQLTLPDQNSDLAQDLFKDKYNFEFKIPNRIRKRFRIRW